MAGITLLYNINRIKHKEGLETIIKFADELIYNCYFKEKVIIENICKSLPPEIQEIYKIYIQRYSKFKFQEVKTEIAEGGDVFLLFMSFLLQSNHSVYPKIPIVEKMSSYQELINMDILDDKKLPIQLYDILDDKTGYFNYFRTQINGIRHIYTQPYGKKINIFNFSFVLK